MEESQVVKEIVNALQFYSERTDEKIEKRLQLHSDQIDKKLEQRLQAYSEQIDEKLEKRLQSHSGQIGKKLEHLENQLNEGFKRVDKRLDNLDKKFTGLRVELTETQETVNFLSSKSAQHEKNYKTSTNCNLNSITF